MTPEISELASCNAICYWSKTRLNRFDLDYFLDETTQKETNGGPKKMAKIIELLIQSIRSAARYNSEVQTAPPASSGLTTVASGRS